MAARKKKTARKKSPRSKVTSLVPVAKRGALQTGSLGAEYDEYIDRDKQSKTQVGTGWPFISTQGGRLTLDGNVETEFEAVILGATHVNTYFEGKFDPSNIVPPTCWAIAADEAYLAPPDDWAGKQHPKCEGCLQNAFGSDDRGTGKACKNTVRLAMLPFDEGVDLSRGKGVRLSVSPTSSRNWTEYVDYVTETLGRPVFSVITQVTISPHPKNQHELTFEAVGSYGDAKLLNIVKKRVDNDAEEQLHQPYTASVTPAKPKKGAAKKKARRKSRTLQ